MIIDSKQIKLIRLDRIRNETDSSEMTRGLIRLKPPLFTTFITLPVFIPIIFNHSLDDDRSRQSAGHAPPSDPGTEQSADVV